VTLHFDERDRASVIGDLSSSDEDVRRLAVERAAALPPEDAVVLLVERLGDSSWRVRKAAVERLVSSPDSRQVAAVLIEALADGENPGRRNGAVEALVLAGPRVLPALLEASGSEDPDVRKLVVDALAGIGDVAAHDRLVELLHDGDPNVRAAAADGLGALGQTRAAAALLQRARCDDEEPLVRLSALRALGTVETPLSASDLAPVFDDPILRAAGIDLLGREDEPDATTVLQKALAASSRSVRAAAMRAWLRLFANVDAPRSEALLQEVRAAALASPELVEDAVEHLEDSDLPTRLVLVQFLGLLRAEPAVVPLLRCARDEAVTEVALATLGTFGVNAEEQLEAAWGELDACARRHACDLFGRTHGERGALLLASALEDPDAELRMAAARGVARRGALGALPLLVRRLELVAPDDEIEAEEERAALADAIAELADCGGDARSRVDALLRERLEAATDSVRVALARVLAHVAPAEDTPLFLGLLKDPSAGVRRVAVEALGRVESAVASEPLRLALADEAANVRIAATAALASGAGEEALPDLLTLAGDPDPRVRARSVRGISQLPACDAAVEAEIRATLERALGDEVLVALAALEALREIGIELSDAVIEVVLARPEPELLREAVRTLAGGDAAHLEALLPLVSHPDWSVRAEAIGVLAERRFVRAAPAILGLLESERDDFVRGAILQALERLEG